MATTFKSKLTSILIITVIALYVAPAHAQLTANNYKRLKLADSSGKYLVNTNNVPAINNEVVSTSSTFYETDAKAVESLTSTIKKPQERRKLMIYLKQLTSNTNANYNKSGGRFYYHLANTFARLRFYPLAMKCFLKAIKYRQETDTLTSTDIISGTDSTDMDSGYLSVNSNDDSVVNKQPFAAESIAAAQKSKAINIQRIINTFNDGKKAAAYAILFHVKQPVPGKRKIFKFANTGHTFITLIKYNTDSTYVSLSFGFYPHKDNVLSATPLEPSTSSIFKDDSNHQWDEVLGKFISKRRFDKILTLAGRYSEMKYHLSKNNCTDFGINAAALAGIEISDTSGKWPFGGGNNPAVTGQSILQHKFNDIESKGAGDIFVDVAY